MKMIVFVVSLLISINSSAQNYNPELNPYIEYLSQQKESAKDYILNLFKKHDLVILCERLHPEFTQYNLFLSIVSDQRFIDSVGNIFTEIGVSSQRKEVNKFIHMEKLPIDSVNKTILGFQRNCSFWPLWSFYNYSYFIKEIYNLNQKLPYGEKLNLYNSDIPFEWEKIDSLGFISAWKNLPKRDSIIASQIMQQYDLILKCKSKHRKALVIMNSRHAYGHKFEFNKGQKPPNVGRFLFEHYGERVANVYINSVAQKIVKVSNNLVEEPIQNGKWDAAFKYLNKNDIGFDFNHTPFGKDTLDLLPMKNNFTFEDVFDGFVFYTSLEHQKVVNKVPGLIDSTFVPEVIRRYSIASKVAATGVSPVIDIEYLKRIANGKDEYPIDRIDSLKSNIDKWLEK